MRIILRLAVLVAGRIRNTPPLIKNTFIKAISYAVRAERGCYFRHEMSKEAGRL